MSMNVIISCELDKSAFDNFIVVERFAEVRKIGASLIDTLIIHHFKESTFDAGVYINEFKNSGIKRFIYISEHPDETVKMCLKGLNSYVYDIEDYLSDEEELNILLEDLVAEEKEGAKTTALVTTEQKIKILENFIECFKKKDPVINAPIYLNRVKDAVNELSVITQKQELQINTMGAESREIFAKASEIIEKIQMQNIKVNEKLKELEESANDVHGRTPLGNSIDIYGQYKHFGATTVLLIREYSPCRYLTTFVMAYEHYLHYALNKRAKLVICHSKAAEISKKYGGDDFVSITEVSYKTTSLYANEKIAINIPKKDLMKKLIDVNNVDIVIVVDRLYGKNPILTGKNVTTLNAISGSSDVARYGLNAHFSDTIIPVSEFTVGGKQPFVTLQTIQDFPPEIDTRYAAYNMQYLETFKKLDAKLRLVK